MVDAYLGKKYKLVSSENVDELMKAIGVNMVIRKLASIPTTVVIELQKEGEEYILTETLPIKNIVLRFKLGQEFDTTTPDGVRTKTVMTIDEDTLTEIQKRKSDGSELVITRKFSADEIKMTMRFGNVVATRTLAAQ